ncbi:hypothetical protein [Pseudoalteromonas mariniglutinosa]|uniref:hypothetical protein n=1 Tax=Pseudoalteromonas mariniglutinosa TaxID=206042 RepID=UPI00384C9ACB
MLLKRYHVVIQKQAQQQSVLQATQLSHYLSSELERFAAISQLVSANALLKTFIQQGNNDEQAVNDYLADILMALTKPEPISRS